MIATLVSLVVCSAAPPPRIAPHLDTLLVRCLLFHPHTVDVLSPCFCTVIDFALGRFFSSDASFNVHVALRRGSFCWPV